MPIPSRITLHPDGKSLNVEYMPRDIGKILRTILSNYTVLKKSMRTYNNL